MSADPTALAGNPPARIANGQEYPVASFGVAGGTHRLQCESVTQRNWSRVATGQVQSGQGGAPERVFIKQNIDRTGRSQPEHWQYEEQGAVLAGALLKGVAQVPALRYQNPSLLLNVFEHVDVVTIDELLRSDAARFDACFGGVMATMLQVLEAMKNPPPTLLDETIPVKARGYGSASTAVNFKGFEIRNAGLVRARDGSIATGGLVMFDFVRPYLAPVEEAAAKLFVSIGLLNWGKPLSRFMRGPDGRLLDVALDTLRPYIDWRAVKVELELQTAFRTREFKGSGRLERSFKRLGVDSLGKLYLHKLNSWCERHIR